jgi:hypothetical protein
MDPGHTVYTKHTSRLGWLMTYFLVLMQIYVRFPVILLSSFRVVSAFPLYYMVIIL